jgi:hypothetical protein
MAKLVKYSDAGVTSTSGMSGAFGSSSDVMLTGGLKRRKKKSTGKVEKSDAEGLITTVDGKKAKLTGLSDKEKDEYLFGRKSIQKAISTTDELIEYLEALHSPEIEEDFENILLKCDLSKTSKLIKSKSGVWRRIAGRPCFICEDGTIHAGPKKFMGKKAATLRDNLRSERGVEKFHKRRSTKAKA